MSSSAAARPPSARAAGCSPLARARSSRTAVRADSAPSSRAACMRAGSPLSRADCSSMASASSRCCAPSWRSRSIRRRSLRWAVSSLDLDSVTACTCWASSARSATLSISAAATAATASATSRSPCSGSNSRRATTRSVPVHVHERATGSDVEALGRDPLAVRRVHQPRPVAEGGRHQLVEVRGGSGQARAHGLDRVEERPVDPAADRTPAPEVRRPSDRDPGEGGGDGDGLRAAVDGRAPADHHDHGDEDRDDRRPTRWRRPPTR